MSSNNTASPTLNKLTGIALASASIIAFQLVMMQQLSIAQWHHFAHLVIATALLGFGIAGTLIALYREWMLRYYDNLIPVLFALSGISMAAASRLAGIAGDFDALLLFIEKDQLLKVTIFYVAYILPFLFGGLAITLIFYKEVKGIGSLYFANMAGSGGGALLTIILFYQFPLSVLPGLLATLPLLAAILCQKQILPKKSLLWSSLLLIPLFTMIYPAVPEPSEYKSMTRTMLLPGAEVTYSSFSPYGQIDIVSTESQRYAPALSLNFIGTPPVREVIFHNGEYFGTLPGAEALLEESVLNFTTRKLPYVMRNVQSVLVLNAATGNDVAHALANRAESVTAVEPNADVIRLLTSHQPERNDSLYLDDRVSFSTSTIRSYLSHTTDLHDLIVLPVLDSFGGSAGVYAINEQYHLTLEAFSKMWERLTPEGTIVVTTWIDYPLRYTLKIPVAWRMFLEETGIDQPENHLAAIRSWGSITYLMSRSPIQPEEAEAVRAFGSNLSFDPLWLPDIQTDERNRFNLVEDPALLDFTDEIIRGNYSHLLDSYLFHLQPATDNRPFFSHFMKWGSINYLRDLTGGATLPYMEAGFVLAVATFIQVLVISILLIVLPLFRKGWSRGGRFRTLLYFTGTGLGFILFEIVLIQQMTLYLGLPVFAAALVLSTLLIGSAAGSITSSKLQESGSVIRTIGLSIAAVILIYMILIPLLISFTMGWPLLVRIVIMGLILLVPAFLMGMMFPLGLRYLSGKRESHIPWACGIDSFFSVTAASLAILLALQYGFAVVMSIAAIGYVMTAFAFEKSD